MMNSKLKREAASRGLLLAMLAVGSAAAHEGHAHMAQGTVKAIAAERLDLAQEGGKVDSFVLTPSTKYLRGQTAEKREGVRLGERAIVHYEERDGSKVAKEVRLGEAKPPATAESAAEQTVESFHKALAAGDSAAALRLLAPEVVIFEFPPDGWRIRHIHWSSLERKK